MRFSSEAAAVSALSTRNVGLLLLHSSLLAPSVQKPKAVMGLGKGYKATCVRD